MLRDCVHKVVRPSTYPCGLCALTYGPIREKSEWACFREELPVPAEFLHRDEFKKRYPAERVQLPCVLLDRGGGGHELLATAEELGACSKTDELIRLVQSRVDAALLKQAVS
jgi:hypothetical protein